MVAQNILCTCKEMCFFPQKIEPAVDPNKCHKQIKLPISFQTCAVVVELPSDIRTLRSRSKDGQLQFGLLPITKVTDREQIEK